MPTDERPLVPSERRGASRQGVTLIELLVVMTLLLMITAVTIPVIAPAIQQRRAREASRLVSSYIAAARSRAMELGRPVAVVIERFNPGLASASTSVLKAASSSQLAGTATYQSYSVGLSVAESPPPYSGDFTNSTVTVMAASTPPTSNTLLLTGFTQSDNWVDQQIKLYDSIRIGYQPTLYRIIPPTPANSTTNVIQNTGTLSWTLQPNNSQPAIPSLSPAILAGTPVPFQIFRQPIRSAVAPLQLPEGIVVDLNYSGMSTQTSFDISTNPMIAFGPSGSLDILYDAVYSASNHPNGFTGHPTGSIFLLLGRQEQVITSGFTPAQTNLADPNSLWVGIGYQTGQVVTGENYIGSNSYASTAVGIARTLVTGSFKNGTVAPVTTMGGN